jgi:hypothetical protein
VEEYVKHYLFRPSSAHVLDQQGLSFWTKTPFPAQLVGGHEKRVWDRDRKIGHFATKLSLTGGLLLLQPGHLFEHGQVFEHRSINRVTDKWSVRSSPLSSFGMDPEGRTKSQKSNLTCSRVSRFIARLSVVLVLTAQTRISQRPPRIRR